MDDIKEFMKKLSKDASKYRSMNKEIDDRDKEWFQVIESILGFHPVSMTDALNHGITMMRKLKSDSSDLLQRVQAEQVPWVKHNFGDRPAWQPLLGMQEELGELSHSYLKREQGIRTSEDHNEKIRDAVADILIYLLDFCSAESIDLSSQLEKTWEEVRKRDWKLDSETAGVPHCAECGSVYDPQFGCDKCFIEDEKDDEAGKT